MSLPIIPSESRSISFLTHPKIKTPPRERLPDGSTPLHKAAWRGHAEVVQVLLAHKANSALEDVSGLTPLDLAKSGKHKAAAALLTGK